MEPERIKVIAITGSRSGIDRGTVHQYLSALLSLGNYEIVTGGAKGVDRFAIEFAELHGIKHTEILPDYNRYSTVAPIIRNKEIVKNADMVYAFWDGLSKGTLHTITYASKIGKRILVIKN